MADDFFFGDAATQRLSGLFSRGKIDSERSESNGRGKWAA
jgi:hypothetical protein